MLSALSVLFTAMPFVVALLLGLVLPLLLLAMYRRFEVGAVFIGVVFAIDAATFGGAGLNLGINIYGNDVVYGLVLLVATARWLLAREMPKRPLLWLAFAALVSAALGLGLLENGRRAGVHAREVFYMLACASYAMSFAFDGPRLRRLLHVLAWMCVAMALVSIYRWVVYFAPLPELLPPGGQWSPDVATRVIGSHETLIVAQWLVLGLFFAGASGAAQVARWLAPALLALVVVMQHRSVWVAAMVGLLAALAVGPAAQRSRLGARLVPLVALVVAAVLVALPLVYSERAGGLTREISTSMDNAVAARGTVHARLSDWRLAINQYAEGGPRVWLVGQGFGRETRRIVASESGERRYVEFGLHNHYLTLLMSTGLVGLMAYLGVVLGAATTLMRSSLSGEGDWVGAALWVLLVTQLAYQVPYAGDPFQHLLLGAAVAHAAQLRLAQRARLASGAERGAGARVGEPTGVPAVASAVSPVAAPAVVAQPGLWR